MTLIDFKIGYEHLASLGGLRPKLDISPAVNGFWLKWHMPADLKDPQYWRYRAEEAMSVAENLVEDPELQEILRRVADDYERAAKYVERRRGRERKP